MTPIQIGVLMLWGAFLAIIVLAWRYAAKATLVEKTYKVKAEYQEARYRSRCAYEVTAYEQKLVTDKKERTGAP